MQAFCEGSECVTFSPLPESAAYRHIAARDGFEVVFISTGPDGIRFEGQTSAVEDGNAWSVDYVIELTPDWLTRRARISNLTAEGRRELLLESDLGGNWHVNGEPAPDLEGLLDVDIESSAVTNAIPVHRMALEIGDATDAPAVYVRAQDLTVMRLEQRYERRPDGGRAQRYAYIAPAFDAYLVLVYDDSGLVTNYPGLAVRVL
jgi:hypothetical protein